MANITQTISSLTTGISQQPDEQKIPGQVKDMVNALPDVVQGLLKRPAGKFVDSLSDGTKNSDADGKWFHYYRDENEQYIGQVHRTTGAVRMWDCLTGDEKNVVNGIPGSSYAYFQHTDDEQIQTLTLNDFTYINNRGIEVEMDTTVEPLGNFEKEVFIELKSVAYAKQYSLNIFDQDGSQDSHFTTVTTATRINVELLKSSNNYCNSSDGGMLGNGSDRSARTNDNNVRCDDTAGDSRDAYAPNVGTRIFDVTDNGSLTDIAIHDTHTYNVNVFNDPDGDPSTTNVDVSTLTGTSARTPKNLYFRIATTGQSVPYTEGSGSSSTTTYQARYTTTYDLLHGGEGWEENDYFYVWMKDAYYKVTVEAISTSKVQANLALVRPNPTPFDNETTVTAESILGDIRTEIINGGPISASDITMIGNGIHIKRSANFNAATPVKELLNVVSGKVNDIGDLPSQCKHGMVVEVVNSAAEEDNYYVKFLGNGDRDGEGIWEECAKPGRKIRLKRSKMPHLLIRTADGNFRLTELDGSTYTINGVDYTVPKWDDAEAGDEDTNPEPSFVGKKINKMLFFRNRFAILADEYIVLSRPGDFTNFFSKSAIQFIASDPVDIAASSEYPAVLYDGIQTNTGLVLFSKNQQFMLTTDSDLFSPTTAKINALSSYNFNFATNPISFGTTIGFLDNAGKFSRFFEMAQIQREGEPVVIEQSAVVPKLFEKDLKLISNSRENSVVFFSEEDSSTLYGYRYFDQITERKLASWFKWTLTGKIQYHCVQDDALFVVVRNNAKDQLLRYSIKIDSNTFTVDSSYRVHLDHLMSVTAGSNTYSATTNLTTIPVPTGFENTESEVAAYEPDAGNDIGRYSKRVHTHVIPASTLSNNTFTYANHGFNDNTKVLYSPQGGTPLTSSVTNNIYYINKIDDNSFKLRPSGGSGFLILSGGNEKQTLTKYDEIALTGDWSSNTFLLGYLYSMEVELPTFYYVTKVGERFKADTRSNTILHRVKFGFGPMGIYETILKRLGRIDYNETFEIAAADTYLANTAGVVNDEVLRTVPIYDRNTNTILKIRSTHPAPATIHNLTWEGVLNNNFYQSV